jgi:hypothetical protein
MGKKFILTEEERQRIKQFYQVNESEKSEDRKFCHAGNTKSLEEIMGDDEDDDYIEGVKLRKNGIRGMVDKLELLKTLRLHPKVSDGGEHLAYEAMDKIIELYKENEHGEELVKDIEKVYSMQHLSPRAKEFLKHGIGMIKGQ